MKEKKTATIVLAVACGVTVLCVALGIGLRAVPGVSNVKNIISDIKSGKGEAASDETVYDSIKTLDLDIDLADVTIVKGNENKVKVSAEDKRLLPEISYDGTMLSVEQNVEGMDDGFHFMDFASFGNSVHASVEITLKDDLESLDADVSLGDINISGIAAKEFNFEAACGDVDITDCTFGSNAVLDVQLGDIDIKGCTADNLFVASSMGDVDMENVVCGECNLDINTGDLEIIGGTFESLTASLNLGEVTVDTAGAYENYTISAETDLGEVKVDGSSMGMKYNSGSAAKKIEVHNDLGAINIK